MEWELIDPLDDPMEFHGFSYDEKTGVTVRTRLADALKDGSYSEGLVDYQVTSFYRDSVVSDFVLNCDHTAGVHVSVSGIRPEDVKPFKEKMEQAMRSDPENQVDQWVGQALAAGRPEQYGSSMLDVHALYGSLQNISDRVMEWQNEYVADKFMQAAESMAVFYPTDKNNEFKWGNSLDLVDKPVSEIREFKQSDGRVSWEFDVNLFYGSAVNNLYQELCTVSMWPPDGVSKEDFHKKLLEACEAHDGKEPDFQDCLKKVSEKSELLAMYGNQLKGSEVEDLMDAEFEMKKQILGMVDSLIKEQDNEVRLGKQFHYDTRVGKLDEEIVDGVKRTTYDYSYRTHSDRIWSVQSLKVISSDDKPYETFQSSYRFGSYEQALQRIQSCFDEDMKRYGKFLSPEDREKTVRDFTARLERDVMNPAVAPNKLPSYHMEGTSRDAMGNKKHFDITCDMSLKRVLVKELDPGSSEEDLSVEVVFEPKKDKQKKQKMEL